MKVICKNKACQRTSDYWADDFRPYTVYYCSNGCEMQETGVTAGDFFKAKMIKWGLVLGIGSLLTVMPLALLDIFTRSQGAMCALLALFPLGYAIARFKEYKDKNIFYDTAYISSIISVFFMFFIVVDHFKIFENLFYLIAGLLAFFIGGINSAFENPFVGLGLVITFVIYIATQSIINAIENHNCR